MKRRFRAVLLLVLILGQTGGGLIVTSIILKSPHVLAAPANHTIPVGPGFTDVSPHQIVRTSTDLLYVVGATCDAAPSCTGNALQIYRADQPGTPAGFTEEDGAHRPIEVGSSAIALD